MAEQLILSNDIIKAMEPWCGCQDFVDSNYDFKSKKGIIKLSGREEKTKTHKIIF